MFKGFHSISNEVNPPRTYHLGDIKSCYFSTFHFQDMNMFNDKASALEILYMSILNHLNLFNYWKLLKFEFLKRATSLHMYEYFYIL